MNEEMQKAVAILKQGGIVIFPTDTVYGIGCRIDNEASVQRLYTLRKREETKPSPVLAADLSMLKPFLKPLSQKVKHLLIDHYWPGGLTIILPCISKKVSKLVRGGTDTLGVRVPNQTLIQNLIAQLGVPIIGTSANFPGEPAPTKYNEIDPTLAAQVDYVLQGECLAHEASTIIDVTKTPWKIVRQGALKLPKFE